MARILVGLVVFAALASPIPAVASEHLGDRDVSFLALKVNARGEALVSPKITAGLLQRLADLASDRGRGALDVRLTRREAEILDLIDQGLSNKEIAHRLSIAVSTVKNHVHSILDKLDVDRRAEAVARVRGTRM